jgi:hypothetical protein
MLLHTKEDQGLEAISQINTLQYIYIVSHAINLFQISVSQAGRFIPHLIFASDSPTYLFKISIKKNW